MKNRTINTGYSGTSGVVEGFEDGEVGVDEGLVIGVGLIVGEGEGVGVGCGV